jgi:hypothetical protein
LFWFVSTFFIIRQLESAMKHLRLVCVALKPPYLSSGARFGRHNDGGKSNARCGVGGGQPNMPLVFSPFLKNRFGKIIQS